MRTEELDFSFPEELIATEPVANSRVMWMDENPSEMSLEGLIEEFEEGDVLVTNNTEVLKRRVFTSEGLEVLFIKKLEEKRWQVLMPARKVKSGEFTLPNNVSAKIIERGRPQVIEVDEELSEGYFQENGELPLPPYIQKARGERKPVAADSSWYQTAWAAKPGSLAAPTAGLHFKDQHIKALKEKGVKVLNVTLHVGLGTFLPVTSDDLNDHEMHFEEVSIEKSTWQQIKEAKEKKGRVWALGTTSVRSLEAMAQGHLKEYETSYQGETNLFIQPGFDFQIVDRLLTNFHQPKSTLLALVAGFAGLERVKEAYTWAVEKKFRLFSYGDLTAWTPK